jgi:hypothetical protein
MKKKPATNFCPRVVLNIEVRSFLSEALVVSFLAINFYKLNSLGT